MTIERSIYVIIGLYTVCKLLIIYSIITISSRSNILYLPYLTIFTNLLDISIGCLIYYLIFYALRRWFQIGSTKYFRNMVAMMATFFLLTQLMFVSPHKFQIIPYLSFLKIIILLLHEILTLILIAKIDDSYNPDTQINK